MPEPPPLSGWQYVVLECVKLLVPVALALVAIWQADKANDRAADAGRTATEARTEVGKMRPFMAVKE